MHISHLFESAESDVEMFRRANKIRAALLRYFLKPSDNGYNLIRGSRNGDNYAWITAHDIGITGEGSDITFLFKNSGSSGGAFNPKKNIIIVKVSANLAAGSDEIAAELKHDPHVHKVLQHEIIHYLDNKRNPTLRKLDTAFKPQGAVYFNSPHEMNAYINNILDPLLQFVSQAKTALERGLPYATIARIADQKNILPSFHDTLELLYVDSEFSVGAGFIKHMDERSKRSLVRRAVALHYEAMRLLDQAKNKTIDT